MNAAASSERPNLPATGRLGLIEPGAQANLDLLGWRTAAKVPVLWALSRAADADATLRALVRLAEALGPEWDELDAQLDTNRSLRGRLFGLFGGSLALADFLIANPQEWRLLARDAPLPTRADLIRYLNASVQAEPIEPETESGTASAGNLTYRAAITGPDAVAALRHQYRRQLLVLAARDLAPTVENEPVPSYVDVTAHLSDLADAALTAALAVAVGTVVSEGENPGRLGVIAMGKCGARELNYVSDVDVIFVAEPADARSARIAGEMMRIGSQAFFDVDAALRPEGKSGQLTRTLESHLTYYDRWAQTWEFQALLKARAMTGDMELAEQYVAATKPLVWEASERADFVSEVQRMRRRVEDNVPEELRSRELKLGRGGLRDVEFAVQLLQLVHGRSDHTLTVLDTVGALRALGAGGYVGRDDSANLIASYEFLRLLEHRLQLQRMRRTHLLPPFEDDEEMRWLARAAHVRPEREHDALGVLRVEIKRHAARVRRLHEKIFYAPLLESIVALPNSGDGLSDNPLRMADASIVRRLGALGYQQPESALGHLRALVTPTRAGKIQRILLPSLLEWLGGTTHPDAGLLNYRKLSEACTNVDWYLRVLRDESVVAKRLMRILGSSTYTAGLLERSPDVIRLLADGPTGPKLIDVDPEEVSRGIVAAAVRRPDVGKSIAIARSLRRAEIARVACADILGLLDVPQVCHALSTVWAGALDAALAAVIADRAIPVPPADLAPADPTPADPAPADPTAAGAAPDAAEPAPAGPRYPDGIPARIAVIGMGRLGGAEIGYGSDADVLFVCEPVAAIGKDAPDSEDEQFAVRWATTVANEVVRLLGAPSADPVLEIDTGLRPEGRNGPIIRTLAAYRAYYREWAQPWEVQALLRATQVAGDPGLGVDFLHLIDPVRYPAAGVDTDTVHELRRIKARVDSERLPRGADPKTHTKLGRGGLSDVEWTVQLLQLQHAHAHPGLHNTSTLESLEVAAAVELISAADAELLREAWLAATAARNAIMLSRGKRIDQLPGLGEQLANVAAIAGYRGDDPGEYLEEYLRVTRRARQVVDRVFWGE